MNDLVRACYLLWLEENIKHRWRMFTARRCSEADFSLMLFGFRPWRRFFER